MRAIEIGEKFGFLKVVSLDTDKRTPKGKASRAYAACQCKCGKVVTVRRGMLFNGERKTCGQKKCSAASFVENMGYKGVVRYLTSDGYKRVHGAGWKREHRVVMEAFLGRSLTIDEVVHHRNGVRTDNRIENLELCSRSDHSKAHHEIKVEVRELRDRVQELEKKICLLTRESVRLSNVS